MTLLTAYLIVSGILCIFYSALISYYQYGWKQLPAFTPEKNYQCSTRISVLIPARNEAENLPLLLQDIRALTYSRALFEVIIIDDHSTDHTAAIVEATDLPNVRLLSLSDAPTHQQGKKAALSAAIQQAKGSLIVCTDADCHLPRTWLSAFAECYEKNHWKFIAAPVAFFAGKNSLERFQVLDFFGMMCITGAGIQTKLMRMSNGASLAYEKNVFIEVNGFENINHVASGDDMLLLQKIAKKYPHQIGFLKYLPATVHTAAKSTWSAFFQQRLRWASKSSDYTEWQVTALLAGVYLFCVNIVVSLFLIPWAGKWAIVLFLVQLLVKSWFDYRYLSMMATWFKRPAAMRSFVTAEGWHILYILTVGTAANFIKKYRWKGRQVR